MVVIIYYWCMNTMRNPFRISFFNPKFCINPFRISFFHPKFCINRLVGADHYKPKLRISTNLRSWTKFASSEHANENCTKIAQILRHMDESCTKIARIASDEKCAEIARKIARKIQSGQTHTHQATNRQPAHEPATTQYSTLSRRRNRAVRNLALDFPGFASDF